jgi:hypothetical protein
MWAQTNKQVVGVWKGRVKPNEYVIFSDIMII